MVRKFVLFCAVGASGMAVDLATVAAAMSTGLWFGWARMTGFATAVTWNFLLDDALTFAPAEGETRRHPKPIRYLLFVGTCAVGMALNWTVSTGLYTAVPFFREHYLLAAVAGVVAGTGSNFAGSWLVVFRPR